MKRRSEFEVPKNSTFADGNGNFKHKSFFHKWVHTKYAMMNCSVLNKAATVNIFGRRHLEINVEKTSSSKGNLKLKKSIQVFHIIPMPTKE
jgi:hypothetical protein